MNASSLFWIIFNSEHLFELRYENLLLCSIDGIFTSKPWYLMSLHPLFSLPRFIFNACLLSANSGVQTFETYTRVGKERNGNQQNSGTSWCCFQDTAVYVSLLLFDSHALGTYTCLWSYLGINCKSNWRKDKWWAATVFVERTT